MGRIYKRNILYYLNKTKEGETNIYIQTGTSAGTADTHIIWTDQTLAAPLPTNFTIPQLSEGLTALSLEGFYASQQWTKHGRNGDIKYLYDTTKDHINTSYYDGNSWIAVS